MENTRPPLSSGMSGGGQVWHQAELSVANGKACTGLGCAGYPGELRRVVLLCDAQIG